LGQSGDFMGADLTRWTDGKPYDAWFRRQVHAGIEDANAGRVVASVEVKAEFAVRRAETLRKLGGMTS
jgi:hypothetical protein